MDNNIILHFKYFYYGKKIFQQNGNIVDEGYCFIKSDQNLSDDLCEDINRKFGLTSSSPLPANTHLGQKLGVGYIGKRIVNNIKYFLFVKYSIGSKRDKVGRLFIQNDYILINEENFQKLDYDPYYIFKKCFYDFENDNNFINNNDPEIKINNNRSTISLSKEILKLPNVFFTNLYSYIFSNKQIILIWDYPNLEELVTELFVLLFPSKVRSWITFSTYASNKSEFKIQFSQRDIYLDKHETIFFQKLIKIKCKDNNNTPEPYKNDLSVENINKINNIINKNIYSFNQYANSNEIIETINLSWQLNIFLEHNKSNKNIESLDLLSNLSCYLKENAKNKNLAYKIILSNLPPFCSLKENDENRFKKIIRKILFLLFPLNDKKQKFVKDCLNKNNNLEELQNFEWFSNILENSKDKDKNIIPFIQSLFNKITEQEIPESSIDKINKWMLLYSGDDNINIRKNIIENIIFSKKFHNYENFIKICKMLKSIEELKILKHNIEQTFNENINKINYLFIFNSIYSNLTNNYSINTPKNITEDDVDAVIDICEIYFQILTNIQHKKRLLIWICIFIENNISIINNCKKINIIEKMIFEYIEIFKAEKLSFPDELNNLLNIEFISNKIKSEILFFRLKMEFNDSLCDFESNWKKIIELNSNDTELHLKMIFEIIESIKSKSSLSKGVFPFMFEQLVNISEEKPDQLIENFVALIRNKVSNEESSKFIFNKLKTLYTSEIIINKEPSIFYLELLRHLFEFSESYKERISNIPLLLYEISIKEFTKKLNFIEKFKEILDKSWKQKNHLERESICKAGESFFNRPIKDFFIELFDKKTKASSEAIINTYIETFINIVKQLNETDMLEKIKRNLNNIKDNHKKKEKLIINIETLYNKLWPKKAFFNKNQNTIKKKIEIIITELKELKTIINYNQA